MSDPWHWRILYATGAILDEYDAQRPDGRGWYEASSCASNLAIAAVALMPQRPDLAAHVIETRGATPRVFRRRPITVSADTGEEIGERADPITGVELIEPDGRAHYTFLFSDGRVIKSDDLNAV